MLNHPSIGPRLRAQNQQLQSLLADPDTGASARLRAEAALGAIWRPLIADPPLDLTDPAHQRILIDAAVAALQPSRPFPDGRPWPAAQSTRTPSTRTQTMPSQHPGPGPPACRWTQQGEATMRRRYVMSVIAVGAAAAAYIRLARPRQLRWGATGAVPFARLNSYMHGRMADLQSAPPSAAISACPACHAG